MARTKKRTNARPKKSKPTNLAAHAFWSGSLSFGLVNVPVLLYPATRRSGVHLRMISPEGATLERRYFCPRDEKEVVSDELVRGYELGNGSYVIVTDQELQAAEPVKTSEIALQEFVHFSEVPPPFMERGYYLTPGKGAAKAYRLLAEVMEKTGRTGIATFVMRDREYIVAIFAQKGILCAEALRFADEVRDPKAIGLPEPVAPSRQRVSAFERSLSALAAPALARDELVDVDTERLKEIIARKKKSGKDLIQTTDQSQDVDSTDQDDVDLLETIRRSLQATGKGNAKKKNPAGASPKSTSAGLRNNRHTATAKKSVPRRK